MEKNNQTVNMSVYEASDYWDEHDFGEFDDIREADDIRFELRRKKYVGIDTELYSRISITAKMLHIAEDVLINQWLSEKIVISADDCFEV